MLFRSIVFNISEFFPVSPEGPSTLERLKNVFLNAVDIKPENIRSFDANITKETMFDLCQEYERQIANAGGIDVALCEIGANGSIAFNEPGSPACA